MFNFLKKKSEDLTGINNNPIQNNPTGNGSDFITNSNQFGNNAEGQNNSFNNGFNNNGFGNNTSDTGKSFGEPDRFNPDKTQHFNEEPEPIQSGGYNQYLGPRDQQNQQGMGNDNHESTKHSYELLSKSIEVMNSKLDSIRFSLESINQRIANIERIAYDDKPTQRNNQW